MISFQAGRRKWWTSSQTARNRARNPVAGITWLGGYLHHPPRKGRRRMTGTFNGGTPAYPIPESFRGMTKRELIAMHMMAALVQNGRIPSNKLEVADCAISYADALLKELEK